MEKEKRSSRINVGYARPIAAVLVRPSLGAAALRLALEALRSFFLPQFENAIFRCRAVVSVDHPLDERIPLDPSRIGKYLEFVKLWIGSMYYLLRRSEGRDIGAFVDYVDAIRDLYADAGSVYRRVHTTTDRPSGNYAPGFALIHAADPHLNCIPSLHILIVVSNWKIALATADRIGQGRELGPWLDRLRGEAVAITESVLFVKQHSLNCVGVSLYYLRRRYPCLCADEVEAFVRDLFATAAGRGPLSAETVRDLRQAILDVYRRLDAAYIARAEAGWRAPILEFIRDLSAIDLKVPCFPDALEQL
jgi:hypothetical protein